MRWNGCNPFSLELPLLVGIRLTGSWSFQEKWVPKLELGNQRRVVELGNQ